MIRPEVLHKRLEKLDEYLRILYSMQRYSRDEFVAHPERYGSAERFLHLAIEALTDMGNHVIAGLQLGTVDWHSDVPRRLREAGYIDEAAEQLWIKMIGFRNILVHEYLGIDRDIVYRVLHDHLDDIARLKHVFGQFL